MHRFLIAATQRTGSSNLLTFLLAGHDRDPVVEPFNARILQSKVGMDYLDWTPEDYHRFMDEYYAKLPGAKMILGQKSIDDQALLSNPSIERFIILSRRAQMAACLSAEIARNIGHWGRYGADKEIGEIDIGRMRVRAKRNERNIRKAKKMLKGKSVLKIAYEDLYATDSQQRKRQARRVWGFVAEDEPFPEEVYRQQFAERRKVTRPEKLGSITNKGEVLAAYPELASVFEGA